MTERVPENPSPESLQPTSQGLSGQALIVLALILAVAGFVRFYHVAATSLWMDEIWTIELSMGRGSMHDRLPIAVIQTEQTDLTGLAAAEPWWHVWTRMTGVPYPPLYHLILRWWMDVFGNSSAAVRSLSALTSLIAVAVLFDICRLLHGTRIALWAAAIMAISITPIEYAQEARAYPMLMLLGLCYCDALVRIEKFGATRARLSALAFFTAAVALTHYFTVGVFVALGAYALLRLRGKDRWRVLGAFAAAVLMAILLWGPGLVQQLKSLPSLQPNFMQEYGDDHASQTLWDVLELPAQFLFGHTATEAMWPTAVRAVGVVTLGIPLLRLKRRGDLLLWVLWVFGTLGFLVAYDLSRDAKLIRFVRYSLLVAPAVCAIVAAFDWPRWPVVRDWLAVIVLVVVVFLAVQRLRVGEPAIQDWRELAAQLDAVAKPDELMVFYSPTPWITPGMWYMNFKYFAPTSQRPWLLLDHAFNRQVMASIGSRTSLWLIGVTPESTAAGMPGWQSAEVIETTATTACHMIRVNPRALAGYRGGEADWYHAVGAPAALHDD